MSEGLDPSLRPRPLAGRVAMVTGASRGIGLATARALAARGARVAMLARRRELLEEAAAPLGERALAVAADVSDPAAVRAAFERTLERFGRLDVLVNNAGMSPLYRVEDAKDAEVSAQVATNFLGAVYCTREAIPRLREAGGGNIVFLSSDSLFDPWPYLSIYAATKAAVESFALAVRREVRKDGTLVTVLRCGPTWTSFFESWDPEVIAEAAQAWLEGGFKGPEGSLDPRVVAEAVAHALECPRQVCPELLAIGPTVHAPTAAPIDS